MSSKDISRRTAVKVYFAGVDISEPVGENLISLSYTDNEEDEADDLQLKLADREGKWLREWLNASVQSAASATPGEDEGNISSSQYKVTAKSGLNIRSGPGTSHGILGAFPFGAAVEVSSIADGWASIQYSGKDAYVYASYLEETEGSADDAEESPTPENKGLKVQAMIVRKNWLINGNDELLDCGQFELDNVSASGPPSEVTIKCTSLPYSSQIRQTEKSKSWEGYTLSGIANEMAENSGMVCMFESGNDPSYERVEQIAESDISFLSQLCHDAGISLKATSNILVLFDQVDYEAQDEIMTITYGDGNYDKYKLATGNADTAYASCRVSYTNPDDGAVISATAYVEDYDAEDEENQQLEITAKVASVGEAQFLAEKSLRLKNKYEYSASFSVAGDPCLLAGVVIVLSDFGPWDGKYIIKRAKHSVDGAGYKTQIELRRTLEGY